MLEKIPKAALILCLVREPAGQEKSTEAGEGADEDIFLPFP